VQPATDRRCHANDHFRTGARPPEHSGSLPAPRAAKPHNNTPPHARSNSAAPTVVLHEIEQQRCCAWWLSSAASFTPSSRASEIASHICGDGY
jgi:hypothetical protein